MTLWRYGIACVDISTGAFSVTETDAIGLPAELARLDPSEIVAAESLCGDDSVAASLRTAGAPLTPLGRESGDGIDSGAAALRISTASPRWTALARFPARRSPRLPWRSALSSARNLPPVLIWRAPRALRRDHVMEIDAATRANLELTRTLSGERSGIVAGRHRSHRHACRRAAFGRAPRGAADGHGSRLRNGSRACRTSSTIVACATTCEANSSARRISCGLCPGWRLAAGDRVISMLCAPASLLLTQSARMLLAGDLPDELQRARAALRAIDPAIAESLGAALAPEVPLDRRAGNFIAAGHDPALDEARALRDESRRVIASLQASYCELADIRQIKIKHNNFLGYFIEVPQFHGEKLVKPPLNATFIHRQTMADAMRFSTAELSELEIKDRFRRRSRIGAGTRDFRSPGRARAEQQASQSKRPRRRSRKSMSPRRLPRLQRRMIGSSRRSSLTSPSAWSRAGIPSSKLRSSGEARPLSPTIAISRAIPMTAAVSQSSPGRTWRASRPIFARTR